MPIYYLAGKLPLNGQLEALIRAYRLKGDTPFFVIKYLHIICRGVTKQCDVLYFSAGTILLSALFGLLLISNGIAWFWHLPNYLIGMVK